MNEEIRSSEQVIDPLDRVRQWTPEQWLRHCHRVCRRKSKYRSQPLWSFVGDLTGHGSTYSMQICRAFGWDPHRPASRALP